MREQAYAAFEAADGHPSRAALVLERAESEGCCLHERIWVTHSDLLLAQMGAKDQARLLCAVFAILDDLLLPLPLLCSSTVVAVAVACSRLNSAVLARPFWPPRDMLLPCPGCRPRPFPTPDCFSFIGILAQKYNIPAEARLLPV